jgi:hypothetical protein
MSEGMLMIKWRRMELHMQNSLNIKNQTVSKMEIFEIDYTKQGRGQC